MKKLLIVFVSLIGSLNSYAQLSINPEGGINFSTASIKNNNATTDAQYRIGYKAGVVIDLTVYKGFYIQPGIFYTVKGARFNTTALGTSMENSMDLNYLEIPLNLAYRYDLKKAGAIFVAAGPYWGIGMNGKSKTTILGLSTESDIKYGNAADEFKKADFGINFGAGYISPVGIYLRVQYGLGLSDISNSGITSWKNRVLSASIGYKFELNER